MANWITSYAGFADHRNRYSRLAAFFLTWVCCYFVTANALAQSTIEQIQIQPAAGLPADFIAEVDVLFVYDSKLMNQLPFTQFDWISSKEQYLNRDINLLDLVALRILPDSGLQQVNLPPRFRNAVGVLVFASHEDPVAEVIDISLETRILLQIESFGINVLPIP